MKRRLCLILFLLMLVTCVTASGEAADWNYDANYAILRGYNGAGGDVVVPGELDGFTVDVIGVSVFRGETITSLTLPETVLELRSNAISTCDNLTRVSLPQSLVVINRMNFFSCNCADGSYHSRRRALYRRCFIQILRIAAQDYL
ncbi:MAG: leucine-rich repeat protein [Christensenellales bacterium]